MTIRIVNLDLDWPLIASWWKGHNFPCPPKEIMPSFGVFACDRDQPVAVSFVYREWSGRIAFVEWTVSDPLQKRAWVERAVRTLNEFILTELPKQGYPIVLTSVGERTGLQKFYRKLGWRDCSGRPHRHMITVAGKGERN